MGCEFAQWTEWDHRTELDWALDGHVYHDGMKRLVKDLNKLYKKQPALHQRDVTGDGFRWIQCDDAENSVYCFERIGKSPDDVVIVALNFTPIPRYHYKVGVPKPGFYSEILNTDSSIYGGSNVGNIGGVYSESGPQHGYGQHVALTLPPLGMVVLKPIAQGKPPAANGNGKRPA